MSKETELLPCPFCGSGLYAQWNRANPKARCETVGCMGAKLPILNLDQPDDIAAWNRRDLRQGDAQAAPAAATGWKWVPLAPTAEMLQAGQDTPVSESDEDAPEDYKAVYRAMLAAAPHPQQIAGLDKDAEITTLKAERDALKQDAERLDWLDQNIFSRENINFMGQLDPTMNMWVTFSPKGHQGSARNILDAAMQAQGVKS